MENQNLFKKRGMRKEKKTVAVAGQLEPDTPFQRKCRMTWAALNNVRL